MTADQKKHPKDERPAKAGMDLIVTGWVGLEGTVTLVREKEEELLGQFPGAILGKVKTFAALLDTHAEETVAKEFGAAVIIRIGEGGILAGLWELGEASRVGLEVVAKRIPIRQESIEIAEYFGADPYKLNGGGSCLIATADGTGLLVKLQEAGIPAAWIGKVTAGNDRILRVDGVTRYMERIRQTQSDKKAWY